MLCVLDKSDKLEKDPDAIIAIVDEDEKQQLLCLKVNALDVRDDDICTLEPGKMMSDTIVNVLFG